MTCTSGFGLLLQLPSIYRPDAYLVGMDRQPGTGNTPFERLAAYVFGLVYVCPMAGMLFAHYSNNRGARRATAVVPLMYHAASSFAALFVFTDALNPMVASPAASAMLHGVFALLFMGLIILA